MASNSTVCSAASTGPGSWTHARPLPSASWWAENWVPRKREFEGWNPDWSQKHIQGLLDYQVNVVYEEIDHDIFVVHISECE